MSHYVVKVSSAKMPSRCWGRYKRVAVMEMEDGAPFPKMISDHTTGCIRVVRTWEKCFAGKSDRCAAGRAFAAANELAEQMNAQEALRVQAAASAAVSSPALV